MLKTIAHLGLILSAFIFTFFANAEVGTQGKNKQDSKQNLWVSGADAGIYSAEFDPNNGTLSNIQSVVSGINSDYIVQHPLLNVLYSVGRPSSTSSSVQSYIINDDASLVLQSEKTDRGADGAHINVSPNGKYLAVAYYTGGDIDVYALKKDGSIGDLLLHAEHDGSSVNKDRQNAGHPHWVGFSQDNRFLYVPDLGTDHIWVYKIKRKKIKLAHKIQSKPGAGPRHLAFHPSLPFAYASDELVSGVTSYAVDIKSGALKPIESLPSAVESSNESWHSVSDIRIHPSGLFLYLVNRGFDQVSVFSIDQKIGKLTPVEREPVRGSISRNIVITDDGMWALVVSKLTNSLAVFQVDQKTGELTFMSGHIYPMTTPRAIVLD